MTYIHPNHRKLCTKRLLQIYASRRIDCSCRLARICRRTALAHYIFIHIIYIIFIMQRTRSVVSISCKSISLV